MPGRKAGEKQAGGPQDALRGYRGKRSPRRSGEPAGTARRAGQAASGRRGRRRKPRFVVQHHEATSDHYDFRLEASGMLKSWAVPKGPSADPADKRLAVPTEDHPLEYESFEGVIPAGEYGAGPVIVWDTGTYDNRTQDSSGHPVDIDEAIGHGHVSVVLHGRKLRGGFSLTRMRRGKQEAWLLVKKADSDAGSRHQLPGGPESVKSGRSIEQVEGGSAP